MTVSELDTGVFGSSSSREFLHSINTHPAVRGRVELLGVAFGSFPPIIQSFELSGPATDAFQSSELQGPMNDVVGEAQRKMAAEAEQARFDREFKAIIADTGIGAEADEITAQVAGGGLDMLNSSSAQAIDAAPTTAQMRKQIGMEPSYA